MHYKQYRKIRNKNIFVTHTETEIGVPSLYANNWNSVARFSNFHYVLFKWTSKFCEYVEPTPHGDSRWRNKHSISSLQLHIIIITTLTTWYEYNNSIIHNNIICTCVRPMCVAETAVIQVDWYGCRIFRYTYSV